MPNVSLRLVYVGGILRPSIGCRMGSKVRLEASQLLLDLGCAPRRALYVVPGFQLARAGGAKYWSCDCAVYLGGEVHV